MAKSHLHAVLITPPRAVVLTAMPVVNPSRANSIPALSIRHDAGSIMRASLQGYPLMEAEQLNQLAGSLSGLQQRAADLRRYL
jgi:hypothetical protein